MNNHPVTEVEVKLNQWARWARTEHDYGLGFRHETYEKKLMREGTIIRSTYRPEPDDPISEETETAIKEMPEHLRKVVEKYYLKSGSVQDKARDLNMGRVTFHEHLRMAKYWLLGKWS